MSHDTRIVQFPRQTGQCQTCDRVGVCLGKGLSNDEASELLRVTAVPKLLKRGQELFNEGSGFEYLYAVRSGAFKTYKITTDGEEQIIDFHLPGDLMGFNAVARGHYTCHAVALDTASVCGIRFDDLAALCASSARVQEVLLKRISELMAKEEDFLVTIGTKSASQRLASFLVSLSHCYLNRGFSSTKFILPMSRTDIASYLSLAVETVSRTMTRLQHDDIISVQRNSVEIKNHDRLHALAGQRALGTATTVDMLH